MTALQYRSGGQEDLLIIDVTQGEEEDPFLALRIRPRQLGSDLSFVSDWVWRESPMSIPFRVVYALVSLSWSAAAALPYLWYSSGLPESVWVLTCIMRFITYFLVFSGYWLYLVLGHSFGIPGDTGAMYWLRAAAGLLFSSVYTFMYCVKWYIAASSSVISVLLFSASWFYVFYSVVDKHLSGSVSRSGVDSSRATQKKRECLLRSIKHAEQHIASSPEHSQLIHDLVRSGAGNISCLFASTIMSHAHSEERMSVYEERGYDPCSKVRVCVINVFLGVCLVCLSLSMIEDYGYPLAMLLKGENATAPLPIDETSFLAIICLFSAFLSAMYISATYPIPHKYVAKRCSLDRLKSFLLNVPTMLLAGVIASVRMNSSYSMFGTIAGRCFIPERIGLTFVWSGMMIVFAVDFWACMKITSCALKKHATIASLIATSLLPGKHSLHWLRVYSLRKHFKRAKCAVRNCDEGMVEKLFDALL